MKPTFLPSLLMPTAMLPGEPPRYMENVSTLSSVRFSSFGLKSSVTRPISTTSRFLFASKVMSAIVVSPYALFSIPKIFMCFLTFAYVPSTIASLKSK